MDIADKREFIKISQAVGIGFVVMGAIGYVVKLSTGPLIRFCKGRRESKEKEAKVCRTRDRRRGLGSWALHYSNMDAWLTACCLVSTYSREQHTGRRSMMGTGAEFG